MLAFAVARHLQSLGLVTLAEETPDGDCFLQTLPSTPDEAVAVTSYGGLPQLTRTPDDAPLVQVRTRGAPNDVVGSYARAYASYSALNCMDAVTLDPGGTHEVFVIGCTAAQSDPVWIGFDDNQRPEWVVNFRFQTAAPTAHRT